MAKVIAITNVTGELLGVLRADPVDIGNGKTIRSVPVRTTEQRHHILEVADDLMGKPAHEIHREVRRHLPKSKPHG
jgi:hypothetical protein